MNRMNTGLALALLMVAAVAGVSGCSTKAVEARAPESIRHVAVIAVREAGVPDLLEATGNVRAVQTSDLASQTTGNIVEIRAREGDRVRRGEVLAVIEDSEPRAAIDRAAAAALAARQQVVAANSDLALAESTLKRYQSLYERKSLSPQEFDEVKAREEASVARRDMAQAGLTLAQAALNQAKVPLDHTRIRAPFDGLVTERKVDSGTFASSGMPLFTIEDVRRYRLESAVNETDLRYVRAGEQVSVVIDALDNAELKGTVIQIVPAADPASRAFLVKIELPSDTRLRSGLFGRAQFSRGQRRTLLIPRTAVIERGQLQSVFVLDQNKVASLRYVTLGRSIGSDTEVLTGLEAGEWIVASPGELDLSNKRVEGE